MCRATVPNAGSTSCLIAPSVTSIITSLCSGCAAYLVGCPIRGVILDPVQALKLGIHGQVPLPSSVSSLKNLIMLDL